MKKKLTKREVFLLCCAAVAIIVTAFDKELVSFFERIASNV